MDRSITLGEGIPHFNNLASVVHEFFPMKPDKCSVGSTTDTIHSPFPHIDFTVTTEDVIEGRIGWIEKLVAVWNLGKRIHWKFVPTSSPAKYSLQPKDPNVPKSLDRLIEFRVAAGDLARFIEAWAGSNPKQ